jgi:cell division protein FtsI (penicillin-binding protein 3)
MEQVVERGTAKPAKIAGFTIAGKTGTANKLENGRYSTDTFASFVGFLPSQNPQVTILVVLDSPHAGIRFGGPASGPIFKRIAEATIRYLGIKPSINPEPPVLVARHDLSGFAPAASAAPMAPAVTLVADGPPGTIPDLRGMSAREAVRRLSKVGLVPRVSGDGIVVSQDPLPGTPVDQDAICTIVLQRMASPSPVTSQ